MKTKLLKRLRNIGRRQINVYSISSGYITGANYGYSDNAYAGLYRFGDSAEDMEERACRIFMNKFMDEFRKKYAKHSIKYKRLKK